MKYGLRRLLRLWRSGWQRRSSRTTPTPTPNTRSRTSHARSATSFAAWLANSIVNEAKKYPDITLTVFDGQSKNEVLQSLIENAVQNKFDLTINQSDDPSIQARPGQGGDSPGNALHRDQPEVRRRVDSLCRRQPVPTGRGKRQAGAHSGSEERAGRRADGTAWKPAFGGAPHSLAEGVLRQAPGRQDPRHADRELEQGRGHASHGGLDPGVPANRRGHLDERQHGGRRDRGDQGRRRARSTRWSMASTAPRKPACSSRTAR